MSENRVYFMDTDDWSARTSHLPLELEGAYLRLCNHAHRHGRITIEGRWAFQGMWRCGLSRARSIIRRLASAGMIEVLGPDAVQVCGVRLKRTSLSMALRAEVYARDGMVCAYCSDTAGPFEIDHVHPVIRGGTDDPSNLAVACAPCNRSKGAKLVAEWL